MRAYCADSVRSVTSSVTTPIADPVQIAGYRLLLADDFSKAETSFPWATSSGQWRIEHQPTNSTYRMEVWPNRIVWSLLGVEDRRTSCASERHRGDPRLGLRRCG